MHEDTSISGASRIAEEAFKSSYPAIYYHLLSYKSELINRNKAETEIRYEWYAMQRWGANYWEDFFKQKIMWAETMRIHKKSPERFPRFGYDKEGIFINDKTCFFATGKRIEYIMIFLNSIIGRYLCSQYVSILDNGGYLMQKVYLENIPIPDFESKLLAVINSILDENFSIENLENTVDEILFESYQFSKDEINFIYEHIYK